MEITLQQRRQNKWQKTKALKHIYTAKLLSKQFTVHNLPSFKKQEKHSNRKPIGKAKYVIIVGGRKICSNTTKEEKRARYKEDNWGTPPHKV